MNVMGCTDIAWEFLRRNPDYIADWRKYCDEMEPNYNNDPHRQSIADQNAEIRWGLIKYVDPNCMAADYVFWSEKLSKRSFRVLLSHEGDLSIGKILKRKKTNHRGITLNNGTYCIKIFNDYNYFQLFIGSEEDPDSILNRYIYISLDLNRKNQNTDIIRDVLSDSVVRSNLSEDIQQLLKMMDSLNQGCTQREIASSLFGQETVDNEWSSDSWLRSNIRYRIKKVNDLIQQGYLNYI